MTAAMTLPLSAECQLARQPSYQDMHGRCHQSRDIPLPHSTGILLQHRCACTCHSWNRDTR